MTKKSWQKLKYLENEKSFWREITGISSKSISNCLRPESAAYNSEYKTNQSFAVIFWPRTEATRRYFKPTSMLIYCFFGLLIRSFSFLFISFLFQCFISYRNMDIFVTFNPTVRWYLFSCEQANNRTLSKIQPWNMNSFIKGIPPI